MTFDELAPIREAKRLLQLHGAQEAWRILTSRALDEHLSGQVAAREATQKVLAALHGLTGRSRN